MHHLCILSLDAVSACSCPRYVDLFEQDKVAHSIVWATAFCVAQHPDTYYMNVGPPASDEFYAQEFQIPPGHAIITELELPGWASSIVDKNKKAKKPIFQGCHKNLVTDHALFGALVPTQGPPPLDFVLPGDYTKVEDLRKRKGKGKTAKAKAPELDPFHLIYPLFPENDSGDPMDFKNDGACMLSYESVVEQRERDHLPPVADVSPHTPVRARVCACSVSVHALPCVLLCLCVPCLCDASMMHDT